MLVAAIETGEVGLPAGGGLGVELRDKEMLRSFLSAPLRLDGDGHDSDKVGGGVGGDGNEGC